MSKWMIYNTMKAARIFKWMNEWMNELKNVWVNKEISE